MKHTRVCVECGLTAYWMRNLKNEDTLIIEEP